MPTFENRGGETFDCRPLVVRLEHMIQNAPLKILKTCTLSQKGYYKVTDEDLSYELDTTKKKIGGLDLEG